MVNKQWSHVLTMKQKSHTKYGWKGNTFLSVYIFGTQWFSRQLTPRLDHIEERASGIINPSFHNLEQAPGILTDVCTTKAAGQWEFGELHLHYPLLLVCHSPSHNKSCFPSLPCDIRVGITMKVTWANIQLDENKNHQGNGSSTLDVYHVAQTEVPRESNRWNQSRAFRPYST